MSKVFDDVRKQIDEMFEHIQKELAELNEQIAADDKKIAEAEKEHKEAVQKNDQKLFNAADLKKRLAEEHREILQKRVDVLESGRAITEQEAQTLIKTVNEEMERFYEFQRTGIEKARKQIAEIVDSTSKGITEGNELRLKIHFMLWENRHIHPLTGEAEPEQPAMMTNSWGREVLDSFPPDPHDLYLQSIERQKRAEEAKKREQEEIERDKREHPELWESY